MMVPVAADAAQIRVRATRIGAAAEMGRQCQCLSRRVPLVAQAVAAVDLFNHHLLQIATGNRSQYAKHPNRDPRIHDRSRRRRDAMSQTGFLINSN